MIIAKPDTRILFEIYLGPKHGPRGVSIQVSPITSLIDQFPNNLCIPNSWIRT